MRPALVVLLSGMLTFGVPLAFAIYEVVTARRPPPPTRDGNATRPTGSPPIQPGGYSGRPLPACLIPKPRPDLAPARGRELERV